MELDCTTFVLKMGPGRPRLCRSDEKSVTSAPMFHLKPLKIGDIQVANRVLLAPMSGITDAPFRRMAAGFGAGLVVSEMTASDDLVDGRSRLRCEAAGIGPHVVQLAGCETRWMAEGARIASREKYDELYKESIESPATFCSVRPPISYSGSRGPHCVSGNCRIPSGSSAPSSTPVRAASTDT